jgi:hypothetical protein
VPEPRRISESRPLLANSLFDLHLHDRGSVGFPAMLLPETTPGTLFQTEADPYANLADAYWRAAGGGRDGGVDLSSDSAKAHIRKLFRVCLSLCHAPQYEEEHRESLAQDWAHVPIPRERELFEELAGVGDLIATLLNPLLEPRPAIRATLGDYAPRIAVLSSTAGGAVRVNDLVVTVPHFGAARGGWRAREFEDAEITSVDLGRMTGDLYINDHVFFRNVPESIWRYELGGYPVLKKWLGYRDARRRENRPLTLFEKDHFRSMVQRLAALISLREKLNGLYERAAANAWTIETTEISSPVE